MVDFLVLLQLHFSPQLVSDYEGVQTALREQLQNVSQAGGSCGSNQSEPRLRGGGVRARPPAAPAGQGTLGAQGRRGDGAQVHIQWWQGWGEGGLTAPRELGTGPPTGSPRVAEDSLGEEGGRGRLPLGPPLKPHTETDLSTPCHTYLAPPPLHWHPPALCFKPDSVKVNTTVKTELTPEGEAEGPVAAGGLDVSRQGHLPTLVPGGGGRGWELGRGQGWGLRTSGRGEGLGSALGHPLWGMQSPPGAFGHWDQVPG